MSTGESGETWGRSWTAMGERVTEAEGTCLPGSWSAGLGPSRRDSGVPTPGRAVGSPGGQGKSWEGTPFSSTPALFSNFLFSSNLIYKTVAETKPCRRPSSRLPQT